MPDVRTHFVFIDLENRPDVDLAPLDDQPVHVYLFLGRHQLTVSSRLAEQIIRLAVSVTLIKVRVAGKNALDFALTFHLGRVAALCPSGLFYIISGDKKDFGRVIAHVTGQQVEISRYDAVAELPFLRESAAVKIKPIKNPPVPRVDKRTEITQRLNNPANQSRPGSLAKLRAYLKAALGKGTTDETVEEFIENSKSASIFAISPKGKLEYTSQVDRTPF